jgi:hypothetical protein
MGFAIMKKLIFSLALLSSIAITQPGFAAGSVIDQCTRPADWMCDAVIDWQYSYPSGGGWTDFWRTAYNYWF